MELLIGDSNVSLPLGEEETFLGDGVGVVAVTPHSIRLAAGQDVWVLAQGKQCWVSTRPAIPGVYSHLPPCRWEEDPCISSVRVLNPRDRTRDEEVGEYAAH